VTAGATAVLAVAPWREQGRELARIRTASDATQRQVAAILHVTPATVSMWERGVRRPRPDAIDRWADLCAQAARGHQRVAGQPGPVRRTSTVDPAWLRHVREEAGVGRAWLVPALGVASRTIQSWEEGRVAAPPEMADRWPQACAEAARMARRAAEQRAAERTAARR
jgi:DNA-binding transcriptional regulator YiaG